MITQNILQIRQGLPLAAKIILSKQRIKQWEIQAKNGVYVAFSGGKDSTVLLHLVRSVLPKTPAVFVDTGLEYPEIVQFVKTVEDVTTLRPKYRFKEIIHKYGYPVISKVQAGYIYDYRHAKSQKTKDKRWNGCYGKKKYKISEKWKFLVNAPFEISDKCCDYLKKKPTANYEKETGRVGIVGNMACNSNNRALEYLKHGCNMASKKRPQSWPIAFWTDDDVWNYIKQCNIPYSPIYDMGYNRTGCMFCMFGAHRNNPNRFQLMQKTHPKQYKFCMEKLGLSAILDYIGIPYT